MRVSRLALGAAVSLMTVVPACSSDQKPVAPDLIVPAAPLQVIDRAKDVAEQAEDRYERLDQP